jgi:hypothetical protein
MIVENCVPSFCTFIKAANLNAMASSPSDLIQINAAVSYKNKGWRQTTSPAFTGASIQYLCNSISDDRMTIRVATSFQDAGYGGWIFWGSQNGASPIFPFNGDPAIIFSFKWDGKKGTYVEQSLHPVEDEVEIYSAQWNSTSGNFVATPINYINSYDCFVDSTIGRSSSGCVLYINKTNLPTNFVKFSGANDKL